MGELELRLLGDLEVVRDGQPMALPPSKKTRALLAYLAVRQRPFRREQLCELPRLFVGQATSERDQQVEARRSARLHVQG